MTKTTKELILIGIGVLLGMGIITVILVLEAMHRRGWMLP